MSLSITAAQLADADVIPVRDVSDLVDTEGNSQVKDLAVSDLVEHVGDSPRGFLNITDGVAGLPANVNGKLLLVHNGVTEISISAVANFPNPVGTLVRIVNVDSATPVRITAGDGVTITSLISGENWIDSPFGSQILLLHETENNWTMWGDTINAV